MSTNLKEKLDQLRELQRRVQEKEAVPEEDFVKAGLKKNARLKDIEKEITAVKKKVSAMNKQETAEEIERELEEQAREHGMTLEQFKESLEGKKGGVAFAGDHTARHKAQEMNLAAARAKKSNVNNFDNELAMDD